MSEETKRVVCERRGRVWAMGLNRPDKYNAFDAKMLHQLAQAYTTYEQDGDLWCALLYTTSDNLTSGLDLGEVGPMVRRGEPLFPKDLIDPLRITGEGTTKPVVIAARGWSLTVGTELALAADICVAAVGTKFGQIEVKRGIMPFGGATLRLHRAVGWHNAMRYLLTGDILPAEEAHRIGLVQDLVEDPEELFEYALGIAERIASQAPLAVQASLASARKTLLEGEEAAKEDLMDQARHLMETEDAAEGLRSFLERRDAEFSGE